MQANIFDFIKLNMQVMGIDKFSIESVAIPIVHDVAAENKYRINAQNEYYFLFHSSSSEDGFSIECDTKILNSTDLIVKNVENTIVGEGVAYELPAKYITLFTLFTGNIEISSQISDVRHTSNLCFYKVTPTK